MNENEKYEEETYKFLDEKIKENIKSMGTVNVLIAGQTGVGKSTLLNAVFGVELAETDQGKPVTQETKRYFVPDLPLSIYDTKGLELADYKATFDALGKSIEKLKTIDANDHIHVAWICISEDSRRVQYAEIALQEMLFEHGIPTIVIITKARNDGGFEKNVRELLPNVKDVVRVRAIGETLDEDITLKPMGLEKLVDVTRKHVPEGKRQAFDAAQRIEIGVMLANRLRHVPIMGLPGLIVDLVSKCGMENKNIKSLIGKEIAKILSTILKISPDMENAVYEWLEKELEKEKQKKGNDWLEKLFKKVNPKKEQ